MAIIYSYPTVAPESEDLVVGTDITGKVTKNFTVGSIVSNEIPNYITGTTNSIPLFTSANTIGNSIITQNATGDKISVEGNLNLSGPVTSSFTSDGLAEISLNVVDAAQGNIPDYFLISLQSNGSGRFYAKNLELGDGEDAYGGALLTIDSTNSKFLFDNGNVGIGTAIPQQKLDVIGNIAIKNATQLSFNGNDGTLSVGGDAGRLDLLSSSIFIDYSSNVGIGTTTPNTALEVDGAISTTTSDYVQGSTGSRLLLETASSGNTHSYIQAQSSGGTSNAEDLALQLYGGNVGIGTSSPNSKLEVNGNIDSTSGDGYLINGMGWANEGSGVLTLGDWDGSDFSTRIMDENSNEVLRVVNGGVGIGTTSPDSKLDILGATNTSSSSLLRVRTTNNPNSPEKVVGFYVNTNTERGFISVNQYSTAYSTSSDYRLKENIVTISNSIERLKELKPCRFNFIQGDPNYVVDGFIAHEAAEVIPEAVTGEKDAIDEDNNPAYQGIDQSKIVPLLTAALQEAISKIEQLETRIQTLENN